VTDRIDIRLLAARDSLEALTDLLHRAYAPLVARGLNLTVGTQPVTTTQRRIAEGQCFVAEQRGRIVGTVTVCGPYDLHTSPWAAGVAAFRDRDTAHFHQFAVAPELQRRGLGRRLVAACERWARDAWLQAHGAGHGRAGAGTARAVPQPGLRGRGSTVQWDGKSYRSVVMEKPLDQSPLREHLRTLARYNLWATRELFAPCRRRARRRLPARRGPVLQEHPRHAEPPAAGRARSLVPPLCRRGVAGDRARRRDRARPRRLRERLVEGALGWLPLIEVWPEARLLGKLEYRRGQGDVVVLPFAATLAHVFNHGTHHRGQITAALTAMGRPCPELDMARMLVQESE
jgi:GNAT superfamily N-acetyltransferase